jgi:hypothetical protein
LFSKSGKRKKISGLRIKWGNLGYGRRIFLRPGMRADIPQAWNEGGYSPGLG